MLQSRPPLHLNTPPDMVLTVRKTVFFEAPAPNGWVGRHVGYFLTDGALLPASVETMVPTDFISLINLYCCVIPLGTGNIYGNWETMYAEPGQLYNQFNEAGANFAQAVVLNTIEEIPLYPNDPALMRFLKPGMQWDSVFWRRANLAQDTVNANVLFLGHKLKYLARLNKSVVG